LEGAEGEPGEGAKEGKRKGKQTKSPNMETGKTRLEIRRQHKISVSLDREKETGREGNKVISELET